MMLRTALNALTRLHSRPATLKRLGDTDMYSPCRITPSNYFRFLRGPEYTTIKGVEFIIPVDSMSGQFAQLLKFDRAPDAGTFKIKYGASTTNALNFDVTAVDIQDALRALTPLEKVLVTGSFNTGFKITFAGFQVAPEMGQVVENTLTESSTAITPSWSATSVVWPELIKKGDRILDGNKLWSVDEIMEMNDIGAEVMAYRCRVD